MGLSAYNRMREAEARKRAEALANVKKEEPKKEELKRDETVEKTSTRVTKKSVETAKTVERNIKK